MIIHNNSIVVTIPTITRYDTIKKTIQSLQNQNEKITIVVVVDGKQYEPYFKKLKNEYGNKKKFDIGMTKKRRGWGNIIGTIVSLYKGHEYFVSASDDLIFEQGSITKAKRILKHNFPDGDGVVGFNQKNMRHFCPGAFVMFGDKWADRFPNRRIYFPQYKHFCVDSELWHYAKSENKFAFAKNANVTHIRRHDECHRIAQKTLNRDRQIWWQKKGNPKRYWPTCQKLDWRTDLGLKKPDPWE